MTNGRIRILVLIAMAGAVVGSTPLPAASGIDDASAADCALPGIDDRCEKWARRYTNGTGEAPFANHTNDFTVTGAVNRAGTRAFTVGERVGGPGTVKFEMQTVAYDLVTGERLWVAHEPGPSEDWHARSRAVAMSPDDRTIFVAGHVTTSGKADVLIVAYDAATGQRRWRTVYDGPTGGVDLARAVAASASGELYVAASVEASDLKTISGGADLDFALLTLDASSGNITARMMYGGAPFKVDGRDRASSDVPSHIAMSPDGSQLVVAGSTFGRAAYAQGRAQVSVVAWEPRDDASQGLRQRWEHELPGTAIGVAALDDGSAVLAGASSEPSSTERPHSVVRFAPDGSLRWKTRFELGRHAHFVEEPVDLLMDHERSRVYLPGLSRHPTESYGTMGAVALDAAGGTVVWTAWARDARWETMRIFDDGDYFPVGALDPASGHVQLAGTREGMIATVSLDRRTGAKRWVGWYDHPLREGPYLEQSAYDWPMAMRAAAGRVVVFGASGVPNRQMCPFGPAFLPCSREDVLTIAYEV
ncbi:MAG TPA: PQQ-binding-like beta-propeller repeat protein [Actinomycetota bacterium]|nr:PQQ-binding-like beta-propeller repeat protein [Actinomycetota bacterium]